MNPNHYLAVAIDYLYAHRPGWAADAAVGKTLVSSLDDRPGRRPSSAGALVEVPVGFKWFVPGLLDGSVGFGGEESAGASFLRRDGTVWTTDKDGILLALLASEIKAVTGQSPSRALRGADRAVRRSGVRPGRRAGHAGSRRRRWASCRPRRSRPTELAGEPITAKLTAAPGNGAADRRAQGDHRERLVRGPARPAPRTSTRSTPSRSRARSTSRRCRRRPAPWSPPPWAAPPTRRPVGELPRLHRVGGGNGQRSGGRLAA